ncbi:hypothetical protein HBH51_218610 [Parastagonospora nodorum]|nr:hypothetical protein HBH51_218610 [Parastagonospora nodorum]
MKRKLGSSISLHLCIAITIAIVATIVKHPTIQRTSRSRHVAFNTIKAQRPIRRQDCAFELIWIRQLTSYIQRQLVDRQLCRYVVNIAESVPRVGYQLPCYQPPPRAIQRQSHHTARQQ